MQWDPRHAQAVIKHLLPVIDNEDERACLAQAAEQVQQRLIPKLPVQPVHLTTAAALHAPFDGTLRLTADAALLLVGDQISLKIWGAALELTPGASVLAGEVIGHGNGSLLLQLCSAPDLSPPLFTTPSWADAWQVLCPSPASLLGFDCDAPSLPDSAELLARRDARFARSQKHYYQASPQIEQGVVPDIITMAKGMGNGHPLGVVITRREIAEALEAERYFFFSAGGSPVSCRIGMAVLDVMEEERLWENAETVGGYFKARLQALIDIHPLVGAVHGMGFYLGVEWVRDRQSLEPATEETTYLCDRLRDLGIFMQPTGDYLNILKIKPPMCTTRQSVDFFVDSVSKVLAELE